MAAAASAPPPSAAHENKKKPEEERGVNNMAQAEVTNVLNLQDQEEAVTKMLQSTSMGQYFLGETKMEDFFIPDRTYVPHNKYAEEEEEGGGDELPVLDFSVAAESPSSKKTENGGEPNPQQHHQDYATRKQALISQLLEAAESWGFFVVVNHGISLELISRMQAHAHRFFQLPLQEKLKGSPNGSLLYSYTTGSPDVLPTKWWNESLQLIWTQEQVQMFCDRIVWSQDHHDAHYNPSSFREDVLEFTAALGELGRRIMELLAEGLGLHPDAFNRHFRAESESTLRLNYYPPCPHPDKIEGMYEHSDASMISILHQDQVGGLQILRNGKWVGVRPDPASFVVNIGEIVMVGLFSLNPS
jgi:isopenicillin N synthase-like dioxygenase